jgi:hypothetical protein
LTAITKYVGTEDIARARLAAEAYAFITGTRAPNPA